MGRAKLSVVDSANVQRTKAEAASQTLMAYAKTAEALKWELLLGGVVMLGVYPEVGKAAGRGLSYLSAGIFKGLEGLVDLGADAVAETIEEAGSLGEGHWWRGANPLAPYHDWWNFLTKGELPKPPGQG